MVRHFELPISRLVIRRHVLDSINKLAGLSHNDPDYKTCLCMPRYLLAGPSSSIQNIAAQIHQLHLAMATFRRLTGL